MSLDLSDQRKAGRRGIIRLAMAFLMVVLFMAMVAVVAQFNMKTMHKYVLQLAGQENEKVVLTQTMSNVVRERMIILSQIVMEQDPFKRDELSRNFYAMSDSFIKAHRRLESLSVSTVEKENLIKLGELIKGITELHGKVVELAEMGQHEEAAHMFLEKSLPAQQGIMDRLHKMFETYQVESKGVQMTEQKDYERASFLVIVLTGLAASLSWIVAVKTLDSAWRDRISLLDEIGRRAEVEQELVHARDHLEIQVQERTADLKQTAALLEEAQHVAGIGHYDWRIKQDELIWSAEARHLLRLPEGERAGWNAFMALVYPDDRPAVESALYKAMYEKKHYEVEHRVVLPNGLVRSVHQQGEVTRDADGQPVRILGTLQDITERKAVEHKLRLAASVFENAGEGILVTDAENNIVDVNEAFTQITGFTRSEVLGQNPRIFKSGKHDATFYRDMWNMLMEKGYWHGEIWAKTKSGEVFPKWQTVSVIRDENGKITNHIALFRNIAEAKEQEARLWRLAHYDNLCGVANRSLLYTNLRQAIVKARREGNYVAMMLFDLDRFKEVNDTMGHDAGDQLLVHVAQQLKTTVRECDTVARLGGDEFAVVLEGIEDKGNVAGVARKIQRALSQPCYLRNGKELAVGASIGISLYPDDGVDIDQLIKNADRAMYHAKELGRNNCQFFAEGMSMETKPASPVS